MAAQPPMPLDVEPEYLAIDIEGKENHPALQEVSNFIYDVNLVYEISRMATDPRYERYKFSRFIWNRNGRHLRDADRLHVTSLRLGSPFLLETGILLVGGAIGGAIGGAWGLLQMAEKIADWKPDREIKRLELEKMRRESQLATQPEELPKMLKDRGALEYYERSVKRLSENEIKITDVRFRIEPFSSDER
jgi:hypothetical protein